MSTMHHYSRLSLNAETGYFCLFGMMRSAKTLVSAYAFAYFARMNGQFLIYAKPVPVTEFLECKETRLSRLLGGPLK
jgi:hypothetical protein